MLTDLAAALAESGVSVRVMTSRQTYEDPAARLAGDERVNGVQVTRVWTTRFGRMNLVGRAIDYLSFYFSAFARLLIDARAGDVIVAKTDPPLISVVAWAISKVRRTKLVNWLQDVFPEVAVGLGVMKSPWLIGPVRWLRNVSLRGADMNVVLGERMAALVAAEGVDSGRIRIIPNWADGDHIRPLAPTENSLRTGWGLQNKFVVGYSGNMGRAHEFETIKGAMTLLKEEDGIVFLFIGGGAGKTDLEMSVRNQRLHNCRFQPYQPRERLQESLCVPDVHLISLQPQLEGLIVPSKVYGVAAAGRPMIFIGNQDGEVARMIRHCECGTAIPVGDSEGLAKTVMTLRDDREAAGRLGSQARACFERDYAKEKAISAWKNVLTG